MPIIDILDMASGIDCREFVEAALGLLTQTEKTKDNAGEHIKTLSSAKASGNICEYSSVNTFVLSRPVERITGLSYAENLEREIWQKIGAESDALITQTNGISIAPAGISSTLEIWARFGLMFLSDGRATGHDFVSDEYNSKIQNEGRPKLLTAYGPESYMLDDDVPHHNTYQWDRVMKDDDFYKGSFSE